MTFKPGQSGNPKGRPRKKAALTEAMAATIKKTVTLADGTKTNGNRALSLMIREAIFNGRLTFPDGRVLKLTQKQWLEFVTFYADRTEGKPKQQTEVSGPGGTPITIKGYTNVSPDDWPDNPSH